MARSIAPTLRRQPFSNLDQLLGNAVGQRIDEAASIRLKIAVAAPRASPKTNAMTPKAARRRCRLRHANRKSRSTGRTLPRGSPSQLVGSEHSIRPLAELVGGRRSDPGEPASEVGGLYGSQVAKISSCDEAVRIFFAHWRICSWLAWSSRRRMGASGGPNFSCNWARTTSRARAAGRARKGWHPGRQGGTPGGRAAGPGRPELVREGDVIACPTTFSLLAGPRRPPLSLVSR